eukprot:SAG11_NODE_197_length_12691_cov_20.904145_13_plen_127_part_00
MVPHHVGLVAPAHMSAPPTISQADFGDALASLRKTLSSPRGKADEFVDEAIAPVDLPGLEGVDVPPSAVGGFNGKVRRRRTEAAGIRHLFVSFFKTEVQQMNAVATWANQPSESPWSQPGPCKSPH